MSHAHYFLDFLIQCSMFIYSEIHALYYYDIYFDLSIRQFMSASCMSWVSAICGHMQMETFCIVRMRIVSFAAVFRVVTQHSSRWGGALCDDPKNCCEGDCDKKDLSSYQEICSYYAVTKHPRLL